MRKHVLAVIGLVVLLCLLAALGTASGSPDTFTVNTTDDTDDGSCDVPHCSLREAINAANSNPGSDTIGFNIPTSDPGYNGITGTWTISLTTYLPYLSDGGTVISGTTQAVNQGDLNPDGPEIEISGLGMASGNCLTITSADNVIHGLVINRCLLSGILIRSSSATTNTISGNYIGTDASGSSDLGNSQKGVVIQDGAQNNVIGGDAPGERNLISGNDQYGVQIYGSGTDGNTVSGNYIGTDAAGSSDLGNTYHGVHITGGAQNNVIGGDAPGQKNVISGNDGSGVLIWDSMSNTISGNYIGTDASGSSDLGNSLFGVYIGYGAQNNVIGGDASGERNIISGNDWLGVEITGSGTMSNTISGNYIGTDVTGTQDRGNTLSGVRIQGGAQNNVIGGDAFGERNIISGNDGDGVWIYLISTTTNTVSGNYIGTDVTGTEDLGNTEYGVRIDGGAQNNTIGPDNVISGNDGDGVYIYGSGTNGNTVSGNHIGTAAAGSSDLGNSYRGVVIAGGAQNNVIGGDTPGERNVIAFNGLDGIQVRDATSTGNTITQNSIHSNVSLGIDLVFGGNADLAAPTVSAANTCFVTGTAGAGHAIEVFTGPDEEGKTYLTTVSADGGGNWSATGPFTLDTYVTATATDGSGNTSRFSAAVPPGTCYQNFLPLIMKNY